MSEGQTTPSEPIKTQDLTSLSPRDLLRIVADTTADPSIARGASERLIAQCDDPEVASTVSVALSPSSGIPSARARLLTTVGGTWNPSQSIYPSIADLALGSDPAASVAALPALSAFRTRDAARTLVKLTSTERPPAVRAAAFAALVQMTGRLDLGTDATAWSKWLADAEGLSEPEWKDLLAEGVWRNSQRSEAERAALIDRMQDGYRRLYLSLPTTPADERTKLTVQLLQSPFPELRGLAIEILNRELAAGNTINGVITEAAAALLRAPEPAIRLAAARLLVQAGPADPASLFARTLASENDPDVATALLAGVARWPSLDATDPALKWLDQDPRPIRGAPDAVLALANAGLLKDPAARRRALEAIRRAPLSEGDPATCRLVVTLGEDADRDAVIALLRSDSPGVRASAAEALTDAPAALNCILAAAASDPALFSAAVRATLANRPTAESYLALERITAPSPDAKRAGLLLVAGELPAAELLPIASRPGMSAELRDAMLARLAEHGAGFRRTPHVEDPAALCAAIMLLAESRLDLKRPDLALVALSALPDSAPGLDPEHTRHVRVVALLWSNRLAEAGALDAPVAAWLDGLERAVDEPHARAIAREIRTRFGKLLDSDQIARFNQLVAKATKGIPEESPGPPPLTSPSGGESAEQSPAR